MGLSFSALLVTSVVVFVVCGVALCCQSSELSSSFPPLLSKQPVAKLLLLGPSAAGKSTLFNAAVALAGEGPSDALRSPTKGLVRRTLALPTSNGWKQPLVVCDAGGGRQERRQWIELVRDRAVGALVFVADVADSSDDTLHLFKQLAHAPWAKRATIIVALTKVDLLAQQVRARDSSSGPDQVRQLCAARCDEYRAVCSRPFGVHYINACDPVDASTLLVDAAGGVGETLNSAAEQ